MSVATPIPSATRAAASATPTPYAVAARALLRDTLLDAARRELEQRAWSEVTMADIAAAAGVSRQTLYKEFGSREEFAQAFVLREAERFIAAVETAPGRPSRRSDRGADAPPSGCSCRRPPRIR